MLFSSYYQPSLLFADLWNIEDWKSFCEIKKDSYKESTNTKKGRLYWKDARIGVFTHIIIEASYDNGEYSRIAAFQVMNEGFILTDIYPQYSIQRYKI